MKISELLKQKEVTISFEVFPPKTEERYESVEKAANSIGKLRPDFMSVTYGAGGGTSAYTLQIAKGLKDKEGVETLCHLTCVSSTREKVRDQLDKMSRLGLENIMALRGDIPSEQDFSLPGHYRYATELIREIKEYGDFCIGGACYPEGHIESASRKEDLIHLKEKQDAGCEFLTTQMFFDNDVLYNFLYRAKDVGITIPILAGIMPITNVKQISKAASLSGTYFPVAFKAIADRFGSDPRAFEQAGIAYAVEQIVDLIANNVNHIHVYSMNKPHVAAMILERLSAVLGRK